MKAKLRWLLLLGVLQAGCTSDFIEPNLENENITLLSPPNNLTTTSFTNTFWWEEVEGAYQYRIQIVDSSFSYISQVVLDSAVTDNRFTMTMGPGTYQWRVRAENSSSHTEYSIPRTLYIDSTANLSNQTVVLVSPSNNIYTNQLSITYSWNTVPSATDYRFQIIDLSSNNTLTDVLVSVDSFSYTLSPGQFKWQVRAQNATSNSLYFSRIINIDTSPPGAPQLTAPSDGSTQPNPVTLTWTRDASGIGDSLFVYADSLYVTVLASIYTTNTTYNYTGVSSQFYFWRAKTVDNAGNWSGYSSRRKFFVQ